MQYDIYRDTFVASPFYLNDSIFFEIVRSQLRYILHTHTHTIRYLQTRQIFIDTIQSKYMLILYNNNNNNLVAQDLIKQQLSDKRCNMKT